MSLALITYHRFWLLFLFCREQFQELVPCRQRRRFQRGLKKKHSTLLQKLRKAKKECPFGEKPVVVKTHLRNMIVLPEMVGSIVGVYNGKTYNAVEIKPEMMGHYLGEFSITYKPVKHGRPGIGATHSSRFIPLKWDGHTNELPIFGVFTRKITILIKFAWMKPTLLI